MKIIELKFTIDAPSSIHSKSLYSLADVHAFQRSSCRICSYMVNRPMCGTRIVHEKYMMFSVDSVEMCGESRQFHSIFLCMKLRVFLVAFIEYSINLQKKQQLSSGRQAGKHTGWLESKQSVWNSHQIDRYRELKGVCSFACHTVNWTKCTTKR